MAIIKPCVDPDLMGGAAGHRTYLYSYITPLATLINRNTLTSDNAYKYVVHTAHIIFYFNKINL